MAGTLTAQQAAIAAIWDQHRPAMVERVQLLERAQIDPTLRAQAREAAHKIAGTAGTFGFPQASELARKCELLLASDAAAWEMHEWVAGIRAEIATDDVEAPTEEATEEDDPRPTPLPVVLVVTEDPGTAERMRTEAGRRGLRVSTSRVTEARGRIEREHPDAVLLDLVAHGAIDLLGAHGTMLALACDDAFKDRLEVARRGAVGFLNHTVTPAEAIDQVTLALQRRAAAGDRVLAVSADASALVEAGIETVSRTAGTGIWDELLRVNPSTIVLGHDQLELGRVIRNDPRWSIVPIVVVGEGDPQDAFAAGADDVAPPSQLVARVRNHLARYRVHQSLAETDPLTGLRNRRTSTAALSHLIRLAERLERPLSVVELDVDHFKKVNDTHGHMAGDVVLRRLGDLLKRSFRGEDVVARWGGEEFVIGLFGMDRDGGIDRMSDLLGRFRAETFEDAEGREFQVTFSAGVAQYPADGADLESLYGAADEALYEAKRAGRDQVDGRRLRAARDPAGGRRDHRGRGRDLRAHQPRAQRARPAHLPLLQRCRGRPDAAR